MNINIRLPIHWKIWWKTEFVWLNFYRNAHYRVLAKFKKEYTDSLFPFLKWKKLQTPISITYIFHPSRATQDMDNCVSITWKFLQDSLVHYWVIPNDNYENISLITSMVWEKDKEWYIEAIIESITI
jgi:hypothetical protein